MLLPRYGAFLDTNLKGGLLGEWHNMTEMTEIVERRFQVNGVGMGYIDNNF